MLAKVKQKDKKGIPVTTMDKSLEDAFPKVTEEGVPITKEDTVETPKVGTMS